MAESIAWALYLIGAVAVLTGLFDQPPLGRWSLANAFMTLLAAIFWPIGALILIAARIWGLLRG